MVGAINIQNASKRFTNPDGTVLTALSGVTLAIKPGHFVSLIGPSGCGKTTLLRAISGLAPADEGAIYLDGAEVTHPSAELGFAFQQASLYPWLSIADNIAFGLRARGVYAERRSEVEHYIDLVGLRGFEGAYPHQVSGGMQQRAALARALVGQPRVLLLDEPLGALDAFTRMSMQDELLRIWREQSMTMVMVTHDVDEAVYLSDEVVIMTPRPARIERVLPIELARPRARGSRDFLYYRTRILEILDFAGTTREPEYYL